VAVRTDPHSAVGNRRTEAAALDRVDRSSRSKLQHLARVILSALLLHPAAFSLASRPHLCSRMGCSSRTRTCRSCR
jgi:hypothetical protein